MDPAAQFLAHAKARSQRLIPEEVHPASVPGKTAPMSRGKKVGTTPGSHEEMPSPATTVAADDAEAAEMARLKYQAQRMQTPEERIRRMPATPALPRRVQSQEILRAQSVASTALDTPAPVQEATAAKTCKQTKKIGKTKPGKKGKKPVKKTRKTKTVKKLSKSKKGKAATAKKPTAKKPTAPPAPDTNANVETVPTLTPHMAEPVSPGAAALPSPAQSPATDARLAHAMTQLYVTSPDAPPESSTPHDALAPTELVEVKAEHDKPDETQDVPRAEQDAYSPPQDASTPQPESVASLLNRAQTTDLTALQALVTESVRSAIASPSESHGNAPPNNNAAAAPRATAASASNATAVADLPRVRTRNKEMHNRRMRFYRTLESPNSPPEILKLAENARNGSGGKKTDKLAVLFEEWMKCNEDWRSSNFVVRMRETTEESQRGGRRWMTQADILAKYQNGRSYEDARDIAQEIVNGKESCPHMKVHHIRPHPNCPTRQDMRLFLVWNEEYETHKKDTVVESLFDCSDGGDKKKDKKTAKNKRKRQSSSSSSSSDSSSSKSSSSSHRGPGRGPGRGRKKNGKKASKTVAKNKNGSKAGKAKTVKASSDGSDDEVDVTPAGTPSEPGKMTKAEERKLKKDAEKKRKQEEREAEREIKRIKAEEKKQETKEKNKKRSGLKKAVTILDACISDTVRREAAANTLNDPNLRASLLAEVRAQSASLKALRLQLQDVLDRDQVDQMEALAATAKKKTDEYNERKKLMQ